MDRQNLMNIKKKGIPGPKNPKSSGLIVYGTKVFRISFDDT